MTGAADLAAALLRWYAAVLGASGHGIASPQVLAQAAALEQTAPSAAQREQLSAAGLLTRAGTLTPDGWAALAQVLDERGQGERGEP